MTITASTRRPSAALLRLLAPAAAATLTLAGCGGADEPSAAPSVGDESSTAPLAAPSAADGSPPGDGCATVDAPLTDIPAQGAAEPLLLIPTPTGWEREDSLDSGLVRFALVNRDIAAEGFAPNAVVTLESVPGRQDPADLFDSSRQTLEDAGAGFDLDITPTSVCAQPAESVEYTCAAVDGAPERPCRLLSVAYVGEDDTYLASVTVQTVDDSEPTYQVDSDTILEGFQMLPPSA